MATAPVSKAAKRPNKTMRFLADIKDTIDLFDDEISSHGDPRATAYENFISSYKSAFAHIWPKIETADVKVVLPSVKDKELKELRRMTEVISSDSSRPTLITENRSVPVLEQILGSMVSRLPNQKPPDKDTCKLISMIFSDLADAHKHLANASRGIADIATLIAPEQLTLVLAAAVPPTLQLVLPPELVSPLSTPPPPPKPATTVLGKIEMVKYCKTRILPTPTDEAFLKYEEKSPVRVLAAAVFSTLEKHLFDETTARADIANTFHITSAQLHKASPVLIIEVDHTFIKEKEKPPPHLQLAERLQNLHLPHLQHPPRRKKHKKQMKSQKILDKTLQQKNYIRQTHCPPTVPILFRTYRLNNMLNFIISCFIG